MPLLVDGQLVPAELLRQEFERTGHDPNILAIQDESLRGARRRQIAEQAAIGRILLMQATIRDPRPIAPGLVEAELEKQKAAAGCRPGFDETQARQQIEFQIRIQRTTGDLCGYVPEPVEAEIEAFYQQHRHNFVLPETFHAADIVCHVNHEHSEEEARAAIERALTELEAGACFHDVAERYSDCKGRGGDLGEFTRGIMVEEWEQAVFALEPGQRTGIFATPFGFHIAELRDRLPPRPAPFEDVRSDIERVFTTMRNHQSLLIAMEKLRTHAEVRVITDAEAETMIRQAQGATRGSRA